MTSPATNLQEDNFRQVLRNRKEQLKAELDSKYKRNIEKALTIHHLVDEDDYGNMGELISNIYMSHHWSGDRCIQVFEIILEVVPESQSLINRVIDELKLAERSHSPVPVDSEDSSQIEYDVYTTTQQDMRHYDKLAQDDPELNARSKESATFCKNAYAPTTEQCCLGESVMWRKKQFLMLLEEKVIPIVEKYGKWAIVACGSIVKFFQSMGNDSVAECLCIEVTKIDEFLNQLARQTPPIDAKEIITKDLLPHVENISFILTKVASSSAQSRGATVLKFLGKSVQFKLIDTDTLRFLSCYEPFFNYTY